jgi:hypothetical protein
MAWVVMSAQVTFIFTFGGYAGQGRAGCWPLGPDLCVGYLDFPSTHSHFPTPDHAPSAHPESKSWLCTSVLTSYRTLHDG